MSISFKKRAVGLFHAWLIAWLIALTCPANAQQAGDDIFVNWIDWLGNSHVALLNPSFELEPGVNYTLTGGVKNTQYTIHGQFYAQAVDAGQTPGNPTRTLYCSMGRLKQVKDEMMSERLRLQTWTLSESVIFVGGTTLEVYSAIMRPNTDDVPSGIIFRGPCNLNPQDGAGSAGGSCCGGGNGASRQGGQGGGRLGEDGSLGMSISLGGGFGDLRLSAGAEGMGSELYAAGTLDISSLSSDPAVGAYKDANNAPRQLWAPNVFVDIVANTGTTQGYEVRFYRSQQISRTVGALSSIPGGVTPYDVWKIEDVDGSGGERLLVTHLRPGSADKVIFSYEHSGGDVSAASGAVGWDLEVSSQSNTSPSAAVPLRRESSRRHYEYGRVKKAIHSTYEANNELVGWTEIVYDTQGWISRRAVAPASTYEHVDTYAYHSDGRLALHAPAHGKWVKYLAYGSNGEPSQWLEQYKNNAHDASDANTANSLFNVTGIDGQTWLTTETLAGTVVSRRWKRFEEWGASLSGENNNRKITEARATTSTATSWNDSANLVTTTYLYSGDNPSTGHRKNAVYMVVNPDGQATLYKYLEGSAVINGEAVTTEIAETYAGQPSTAVPTDYTVTITNGGLKTVEERAPNGELLYRQVSVIGGTTVLEERQAVEFDPHARVKKYTLFATNARTETREYACCGLSSETDVFGVRTEYEYDALGRVKTRIDFANGTGSQPPVRRDFLYDALNRQTQVKVGPLGSQYVESEIKYSPAGDVLWRKDGAGRKTAYAETMSGGFRVKTTYLPDGTETPAGSTVVEKYYADGHLHERVADTGPGSTRGESYSYLVDAASGRKYQEHTPLLNGIAQTGAKITTWFDFADRPWKVVSPSPTETGTVDETNYYATSATAGYKSGQLYKVTKSGSANRLYTYDTLGRLNAEGLDINADGQLTGSGGVDRVYEYSLVYDGANTSTRSVKKWVSGSAFLTESTQWSYTLGGWLRAQSKPGEVAKTYGRLVGPLAGGAGIYIDTEYAGTTTTTTTYKYGRKARTVVTDGSVQLANDYYVYDSSGNLASETGLRGTTSYQYDGARRLASVTTPDPDLSVEGEGTRAQTLTFVREDLGTASGLGTRETTQRRHSGPTGPVVEETITEYYPTSEVRLTYGANTTPSKYTYDHAGRVKTLTTWRSFNLATGVGAGAGDVTTWNYNDAGLLKSKRHADNKGPDYTYDQAGRLKTREWARSVEGVRLKTTYDYDAVSGDLTGVDYADNTHTADVAYGGFNRLGRPSTVTDASGTRSLAFSGIYPTGASYTAGLFPSLTVAAPKDANGLLSTLSLTVNGTTDYALHYFWQGSNRLESIFWSREFDDEIDGYSFQEFGVSYEYEENSNSISGIGYGFYDSYALGYTAPGITFAKSRDKLRRVASVATLLDDDTDSSLTYGYNDRNLRTRATSGTGAYWAYGYDSDGSARGAGQVTSAVRKDAGGTAAPGFDLAYAYDSIGNRMIETTNGSASTYYQGATGSGSAGGNALNQYGSRSVPRLLDVAGLAGASTVWVNGQAAQRLGEHWFKRLTYTGDAAQWPTITVNDSDGGYASGKLLLKGQPEVYAHDDDGNLLGDGRWNYVWDMENRLRRMEPSASAIAAGVTRKRIDYTYDDRSRRVLKTVYDWNTSTADWQISPSVKVGFVYDEWNLLAELDLLSTYPTYIRRYIWGPDLSGSMAGAGGVGGLVAIEFFPGQEVVAVGADGNGNVTEMVDMKNGRRLARYDYDPFGNAYIQGADWGSINPFRFSTKYTETDGALIGNETGLLYYGFRYYNPGTGRWLSRDPIEEGDGPNLYAFVKNNSFSYVDVDGRVGFSLLPWLAGSAAGWGLGEQINEFACWGTNTRTERANRRCVKYFRSSGGVTQFFWGEYDATSNYVCSARSRGGPGTWQLSSRERHTSCSVTSGPTCPGEWTDKEEYY